MKLIGKSIITLCTALFALSLVGCGNDSNNTHGLTKTDVVVETDSLHEPVKQARIKKPNLVIKEWNTDIATNTKFLDHVTTYNAQGKQIEEIEYNQAGQKWRKRYEYDAAAKKTRELLYDGNNRLVSVKKFEYNEFGKKKMTYTYNAQGQLVSTKQYEYLQNE